MDAPATPALPVKPPQVQVQKPAAPSQPHKRDYLIDAVFCVGCGKFMHYMTNSYIADPAFRPTLTDPTPVFHGECYKVRGKEPLHSAPAISFAKLGVLKEAVYRIFHSQLPKKDRELKMMDA